ncbi:putative nucleotidyltransferase [Lewinella aquimaris]|uniref:Putative nucleotidyltransferase n=1 Tax=Neolewinella aquimaris TaxID=1835722 RepID=A0A840EG16_9BACT|nr:nucleotidyltransferase domain-containing protein [Neolewinella aquimaris]MBB4080858.1 putative nucleotidyltransferase [Neolewinella aquimaris]
MESQFSIRDKIKACINQLEPRAEIILYGSRARGQEGEESDWDLLIIVPHDADLNEEQRFWHKLFDLEVEHGLAISTLVKSKEEW